MAALAAYGSRSDRAYSLAVNPPAIWLGLEIIRRRLLLALYGWALSALELARYASLQLKGTVPASVISSPTASIRLAWENRPRSLPKLDRRQSVAVLFLALILAMSVAPVLNLQFSNPAAAAQLEAQVSVVAQAGPPAAATAEASATASAPSAAVPVPPPPPPTMTEREQWVQAANEVRDRGGIWYNQGVIMAVTIQNGWSPAQAAGFNGNFMVESGANPCQHQINGPAYGLAQWENPRQAAMLSMLRSKGLSDCDLIGQLGYVIWELDNTEAAAKAQVLTATDAADAAVKVRVYYERPNPLKANDNDRVAHANAAMQAFNEELAD